MDNKNLVEALWARRRPLSPADHHLCKLLSYRLSPPHLTEGLDREAVRDMLPESFLDRTKMEAIKAMLDEHTMAVRD